MLGGLDLGGWFKQNFAVWITTEFGKDEARQHLGDVIPHFESLRHIDVEVPELAVTRIVVDRPSTANSMFADLPEELRSSILNALHSGDEDTLSKGLSKAAEMRRSNR